MAAADYYLCDVCGNKCFYDANLNWEFDERDHKIPADEKVRGADGKLDYCGDMACICTDCAKTHQCVVVKIDDAHPASESKPVAWRDPSEPGRMCTDQHKTYAIAKGGAPASALATLTTPLFAHPAPAGVVLPERKSSLDVFTTYGLGECAGYNACLDEVAKLNAVKPC